LLLRGISRVRILDTGPLNWSSPNQRIDQRRLPARCWVSGLRHRFGPEHHDPRDRCRFGVGVRRRRATTEWSCRSTQGRRKPARLGHAEAPRARVRPGATEEDERILELPVSFTIISILSGCLTAYGIAMTNGGPVDMTWGGSRRLMTLVVGLGMAEVCSAYPTAGGLTTGRPSWPSATVRPGPGSQDGSTCSAR